MQGVGADLFFRLLERVPTVLAGLAVTTADLLLLVGVGGEDDANAAATALRAFH